jgi:hypothetical protein
VIQPTVGWEPHPHTNCWWGGHGASEVDEPPGSTVPGVTTLTACQEACLAVTACEGVLFAEPDRCYRKKNLIISQCATDDTLDLYVKAAPPLPPLPPLPPRPPPAPAWERVAEINARFRRSPYVKWADSGAPADAAVLIHIFDGWEEHDDGTFHSWRADVFQRPELSASLIWADQRALEHPEIGIPVYTNGCVEGVSNPATPSCIRMVLESERPAVRIHRRPQLVHTCPRAPVSVQWAAGPPRHPLFALPVPSSLSL